MNRKTLLKNFYATCYLLIFAFSITAFAQQPTVAVVNQYPFTKNTSSSQIDAKGNIANPAPRYIDGWMTWARDLADPSNFMGFGSGVNNDFIAAHRYAVEDIATYDGQYISKVGFIPKEQVGVYKAKIWKGGNANQPGTLIAEAVFDNSSIVVNEWCEVNIVPSVLIEATQEIWIGIECVTPEGYPMGFDLGPQVAGKGNLLFFNGVWEPTSSPDPNSSLNRLNFCIRGFIQSTNVPSLLVPNSPVNLSVTPNPDFALSTTLSWVNPSIDMGNNAIQNLSSIIITRNNQIIHTINNPVIGELVSYTDNAIDSLAWYDYAVYATNSAGNGLHAKKYVCVGAMYLMNTAGTQSVNICDAYIYDNGGRFNSYTPSCNSTLTLIPSSPKKGIKIKGSYMIETNYDKLTVYDGVGTNGTVVGVFSNSEGGLIPEIVSGQGALTLVFTSDASVVFDGFEIRATCVDISDCFPPTDLLITDVHANKASFSWVPGTSASTTSYTFAYRQAGSATFTEIANITNPYYTLEGLTPNTNYEWKVKAYCNNTVPSNWTIISKFKTTCDPTPVTYTNNFDSYVGGDVPICWEQFEVMDASWENRLYPCVDTYQDFAHSGTNFIKFWNTSTFSTNSIALPLLDIPVNSSIVTFFARYNVNEPNFEIGVMEGNTFVPYKTISLTEEYAKYTVDMSDYQGTGNRIAFKSYITAIAHVFIDDISVTATACIAPSNLHAVINGSNVDLTWSASATATKYNVYRNSLLIAENITTLNYTDQNLALGNYCYTVKGVCDGGVLSSPSVKECVVLVGVNKYAESNINIYPNPANTMAYIEGELVERVLIYNKLGKLITVISERTIHTADFEAGVYILRIQTKSGNTVSRKLIVNR